MSPRLSSLAPLALGALLLSACGPEELPPPPVTHKDGGSKPVDPCENALCLDGEMCDPETGGCFCTPGSCPSPSICNGERRCENRCSGSNCAEGEPCNPETGVCECSETSCPAGMICDESRHCADRCDGTSCAHGERCEPETGACVCDETTCTGALGACDPQTGRCTNNCPASCPAGESCDDPLAGTCGCTETSCPAPLVCNDQHHCADLCQGVPCNQGESCVSGTCQCTTSPESCPADQRCDATTLKCVSKCAGVTCPTGESCVPTTGVCACGVNPNTCAAGYKCDPSSFTCVENCAGVVCYTPGESCSSATGQCECATSPDSCTAAIAETRCDAATRHCVPLCQGVICTTPGEACNTGTGRCECRTSPDTCTAADATRKCDAATLTCVSRCAGVACYPGETCNPSTGLCACATSPDSCAAADSATRCDAATLHCVQACTGVNCPSGEVCDTTLGICVCRPSPDSCTPVDATTRCDTSTNHCISKCSGVSCPTGETCVPTTGLCACTTSPDSCSAADATTRCDGANGCISKCAGVTCPTGEVCGPTTGTCACTPTSCPAGQSCNASGHCDCTPESDTTFCARLAKECGTYTGTDNCGASRTADCGTCTSPESCSANVCTNTSTPPANDDCGGAIALTFVDGVASVSGDTTLATNSGSSKNCLGSGNDVVYSFVLTQPRTVDVSLLINETAYAVVHVRSTCADQNTELQCNSNADGLAELHFDTLPAGTYYVWADSYGSYSGEFLLEVATSIPNATCGGAIALSANTTIAGSTVGVTNDFGTGTISAPCSDGHYGLAGPDLVYSYTPATSGPFRVRLTPESSYDGALWVMPAPCGADASACLELDDTGGLGAAEDVTIAGVAWQTYFIVVDGWSATASGSFTLGVETPANDLCAAPFALTRGVAVAASTNDASETYLALACRKSWEGPDVVFTYTPTAGGSFTVGLSNVATDYDPALWITTATCGDAGTCAGSADSGYSGDGETVTVSNASAGTTYFIVVDGYTNGEKGDFTITVN